ncbi:phasin family protein [Halomonas sp. YLGW01]|uniref:phasin family protein n=1 Tax=Halomonas sp. YLGW01 TaxID=2773308 RepID=UPI00177B1060|nr:phasin family protein [Halomonas sp. YLGW01]
MNSINFGKTTEQLESLFFGPARAYAALTLDYSEKLVSAQFDAIKAYSDTSLSQARAAMDIKDAEGLRSYIEDQQKIAKDLGERVKGDAEKVVALNQDFAQQSQQLVESSVKTASQAAK